MIICYSSNSKLIHSTSSPAFVGVRIFLNHFRCEMHCGFNFHFSEGGWYSVQSLNISVSDSLRPHEPQHARPPCPSPTPGVHPNPCPLSWWCHPSILSSVIPSPPALSLSQHQGFFQWVSSLHQMATVLEFQLQNQSYQWTPSTDLL